MSALPLIVEEPEKEKPDQAELLARLGNAANLEHASPEAKRLFEQIKAGVWTAEDRANGRKLGQDAVALKAAELRVIWRKFAIRAVIDNYDSGQHLFRAGMVRNIHSECVVNGYRGKGGGNIQTSTISGWLTEEREEEIRLEAMRLLIERERTNWSSSIEGP